MASAARGEASALERVTVLRLQRKAPWFGALAGGQARRIAWLTDRSTPATIRPASQPGARPPDGGVSRFDFESATSDQPGGQRVRVPHLSGVELVASPDGCRHRGHEVEDPLREQRVVRHPLWALHGFADVRDHAAAPAADLVAKDAQRTSPAAPDRTLGHDASQSAVPSEDRAHLDHEAASQNAHLERRVVKIAWRPPLDSSRDRLEHPAVEAHRTTTGAERKPVEVDGRSRLRPMRDNGQPRGLGCGSRSASFCRAGSAPDARGRRERCRAAGTLSMAGGCSRGCDVYASSRNVIIARSQVPTPPSSCRVRPLSPAQPEPCLTGSLPASVTDARPAEPRRRLGERNIV
jgi:hypothetical protein